MKSILGTLALSASAVVFATAAFANGGGVPTASAPAVVAAASLASAAFPSVFGVGSAVPAPAGSRFVALSYVNPRGGISGSDGDGDLSFGMSVGNPVEAVSATFAVNILGLDPFGDSGNVSISLSRLLRAGGNSATFAGIAVTDLLGWGDAEGEDPVYTVTASHLVGLTTASGREIPLQFVVGFGNETTLSDDGLGTISEGAYLGLGVGLTQSLAASISATETQINMGLSASIPDLPGLGVSLGVYDVTDNTSRQQISIGASFSF